MNLEFEWDELKNMTNTAKHGVSFIDAIMVFSDPKRVEIYDLRHSIIEERWTSIGFAGLVMYTVIHTERDGKIRIISARKSDIKEQEVYFNGNGTIYSN